MSSPSPSHKCSKCKRKITLVQTVTGRCLCGNLFCPLHRMPEDHSCSYDYKREAMKRLVKDNPKLVTPELEKF